MAVLAGAFTAVVSVFSLWPFWSMNPVTGLINTLVAISFVATAVALGETPFHRTSAYALGGASVFWLMSWWWAWPPEWQIGPFALLSNVTGYFWFVTGGIALLRYPDAVLATRLERWYFWVLAGWIGLGKLASAVVTRPDWEGYSPGSWWPSLFPNPQLHHVFESIFYVGVVALAVVMLILLVAKLRRSRGMERLDSFPVTVAASTVTISGGVYLTARLFEFSPQVIEALQTVMGASALVTPLAFLMTVLRRRLSRSAVADLVIQISGAPTVTRVQAELRRVLQDPSLTLWVWLAERTLYVDADGDTSRAPTDAQRWSIAIRTRSGERLAVLMLDPALRRHPALVQASVVAAGLALEVQAQLTEVRSSRLRIATAAVDERRRLERDLHDGAQQSLLAASASLSAARVHAARAPDVEAAIDQARDDLRAALAGLRQLARGIHPAVLSQSGLAPAIEGVAERLPIEVELAIPNRRWNAKVETTLYFLVCEALTNTVRHAGASRVWVEVETPTTDSVVVLIRDDGRGGADVATGSGLTGMRDRIQAIGGVLTIDSPVGRGTSIKGVVPCE